MTLTMVATHMQIGSGLSDIGLIYRNPIRMQRGRGVGSVFAGLWRHLAPLAMSGLKALGRQSLQTGVDVLGDMQKGKDWQSALKERSNLAGQNLAQQGINKLQRLQRKKQVGKGILTHTTLGSIKAGNSRRNMLVGHLKRKVKRRVGRRKVTAKKPRRKPARRRRQRRGAKKCASQTGGRRRSIKKKSSGRALNKRRRKTARSIDIFDI